MLIGAILRQQVLIVRIAGNALFLVGPGDEVALATAVRAEGPVGIVLPPQDLG
jgi:hypothetical protein